MDLGFAGQVCVVVGGANGIGSAIGRAFVKEQASVAVLDLDPNVAEFAASLSQPSSPAALGLRVDAADHAALSDAAAAVTGQLGPCQHLVYAVGVGSNKFGFPFWNLDPSDWTPVLRVNLVGAVNAAHVFRAHFTDNRRGTLTFLTSVAGQIGSPTDPPYSAAKAGLINFAQCAAKDLAPYNVRVNTVSPGMIKTALNHSVWKAWRDRQPEEKRQTYEEWAGEKVRRAAPLGRWQEPEDIAAAVLFLASEQAKNITGQTLNVDGGQVMHS